MCKSESKGLTRSKAIGTNNTSNNTIRGIEIKDPYSFKNNKSPKAERIALFLDKPLEYLLLSERGVHDRPVAFIEFLKGVTYVFDGSGVAHFIIKTLENNIKTIVKLVNLVTLDKDILRSDMSHTYLRCNCQECKISGLGGHANLLDSIE